jgi:hypothetical protein
MNDKVVGFLSSLGALLVVFTAMLDPRISLGLAVALLLAIGIYHFIKAGWRVPQNANMPTEGEAETSRAPGANRLL